MYFQSKNYLKMVTKINIPLIFVSYLSGSGADYVRKTKSFQAPIIRANAGLSNKKPGRFGCRVLGVRHKGELQTPSTHELVVALVVNAPAFAFFFVVVGIAAGVT
jgi:hypothetical protein